MKRKIAWIVLILVILMITAVNAVKAATATVTTDRLNLRKEASTDAEIIEKLNSGDKVEVLSQEEEWYQVKHNDNSGYVSSKYLSMDAEGAKHAETAPIETIGASTQSPVGTITGNKIRLEKNVKIRIIPSINGNVIDSGKIEEEFEIITKTNHWMFVQNNEIAGWISNVGAIEKETTETPTQTNPVETETQETAPETNEEQTTETTEITETEQQQTEENTDYEASVKYVTTNANFRKGPSTNSESWTGLKPNTEVRVIGEEGDWYKITYKGDIGYIRKDLVSDTKVTETSRSGDSINRKTAIDIQQEAEVVPVMTTSTNKGQEIVDYAYQFLGVPYVYGTAGPNSFDCSGFTSYVYKHFGYSIPRSSLAQASCGREVTGELQAGDIVLFLDYQTMDKVGHCGIYIGDGNFIHASSGSGYCVKVSTLLSGSYQTRYAGARRVL